MGSEIGLNLFSSLFDLIDILAQFALVYLVVRNLFLLFALTSGDWRIKFDTSSLIFGHFVKLGLKLGCVSCLVGERVKKCAHG